MKTNFAAKEDKVTIQNPIDCKFHGSYPADFAAEHKRKGSKDFWSKSSRTVTKIAIPVKLDHAIEQKGYAKKVQQAGACLLGLDLESEQWKGEDSDMEASKKQRISQFW